MPNYCYTCPRCGHTATINTTVAARDHQWCICGWMLARVWSAPAIHFKGSGFYVTDYKKGQPK